MKLGWKEFSRQRRQFGLVVTLTTMMLMLVMLLTGLADGLAEDNGSVFGELAADTFTIDPEADAQLPRSYLQTTEDELSERAFLGVRPVTLLHTERLEATLFTLDADALAPGEILVDPGLLDEKIAVGDTLTDFKTGYVFTVVGTKKGTYSHAPVIWASDSTWVEWITTSDEPLYASAWIGSESDGTTVSKQTLVEAVPGYSAEQGTFQMMRIFLVLIASFVLTAFFYLLTTQKLKQLGVLKAIGLSNRTISSALFFQVVLCVAVASVVAIAGTLLLASFIPDGIPFLISWDSLFVYTGLMTGLALVGSLLPLRLLHKIDPAELLGGSA